MDSEGPEPGVETLEARASQRIDEALKEGVITLDEAEEIAQILRFIRQRILSDGTVDPAERAILDRLRDRTADLLRAQWVVDGV